MERKHFAWTPAMALPILFLVMLAAAGCNASGLTGPATPTPLRPAPTATAHATLPPVSSTEVKQAKPTSEPIATANEDPTPPPEGGAESSTVTPTPTLLPSAERVHIFEEVWQTVNKNYLYKDFHGADWKALHDKYLPLATNAATSADFYKAISDMVDQLNDDHSRYLSPQDASEEDDLQSGNANYVGIGILSSPDATSLLVIFVFPGSPAEKAGLARRDRITAVDGIAFKDARKEPSRIRGPQGSAVRLTVRSPEQPPRDLSIVRGTISGAITPSGSRLTTDPSVGFLVIPDLWTDNMGALVDDELRKIVDGPTPLKGLIIDLRGNGGGFRTVLENILGDFVTGNVGTFFNQKEESPFLIQKGSLFDSLKNVPLVVLVDKGTESYAEVLAATLQAKGRAKVVGGTSAGNTETIYRYDFEDASRLWLAEESFRLPNGVNLEGRGVIPDATVDKDWTAYTDKDDPDILQALQIFGK